MEQIRADIELKDKILQETKLKQSEEKDEEKKELLDEEIAVLKQEIGQKPVSYWVVVGSFIEKTQAQNEVDKINEETKTTMPSLRAFVGILNQATGFYPVIVGYGTYNKAVDIRKQALKLNSVDDAFLSPSG